MEILFFGSLVDATGLSKINVAEVADTEGLIALLTQKFPSLEHAKYFIAVNSQMIIGNVAIKKDDTIALMPPFSGG